MDHLFVSFCIIQSFGTQLLRDESMEHLGIEPRTIRLKAEYSTIELVIRRSIKYYTI